MILYVFQSNKILIYHIIILKIIYQTVYEVYHRCLKHSVQRLQVNKRHNIHAYLFLKIVILPKILF